MNRGSAAGAVAHSLSWSAALLNSYLGDNWPAPPWEADQVATVAVCLELAQGRE